MSSFTPFTRIVATKWGSSGKLADRPRPQYGWDFPEEVPERHRKRFRSFSWNSLREYGWDAPNPIIRRHLTLPERFQNSLPPSTAGGASFFRIGSGEGLSELVMEFPAVLRAPLSGNSREFSGALCGFGVIWVYTRPLCKQKFSNHAYLEKV